MKFITLKKKLEKVIVNFISTEIEWIPINSIDIKKDREQSIIDFFESLEDDDDVQNIFSNLKLGNN